MTGDTVKDHIRSRRLARALELLLNTDRRIIDIAVEADDSPRPGSTRTTWRTSSTASAPSRKSTRRRGCTWSACAPASSAPTRRKTISPSDCRRCGSSS
ncbi:MULTISPECIES: hypothetical protein [unclassified Janthinobacterium]|uniref:hypothetical protein n=1 Tax=unclassified Janthinobacterium TaxID=2610881 RepID=UPI0038D45546